MQKVYIEVRHYSSSNVNTTFITENTVAVNGRNGNAYIGVFWTANLQSFPSYTIGVQKFAYPRDENDGRDPVRSVTEVLLFLQYK